MRKMNDSGGKDIRLLAGAWSLINTLRQGVPIGHRDHGRQDDSSDGRRRVIQYRVTLGRGLLHAERIRAPQNHPTPDPAWAGSG